MTYMQQRSCGPRGQQRSKPCSSGKGQAPLALTLLSAESQKLTCALTFFMSSAVCRWPLAFR